MPRPLAMLRRLWPSSLRNQVLLAIALALLLAQGVSALLIYRAQHERVETALLHSLAFRLVAVSRSSGGPPISDPAFPPGPRGFRFERLAAAPFRPGEVRVAHDEEELREILIEQDVAVQDLVVVRRPIDADRRAMAQFMHRRMVNPGDPPPIRVVVAAMRLKGDPGWLVARAFVPGGERVLLQSLLLQTLFIYAFLFGAMAFILRRITDPLATLTRRLEGFTQTSSAPPPLEPEGPGDVRRLIEAHNAMEARISALLDEKDVMLGAIGHDLKTPLAALRVRIESVEDEGERGRMAGTIEDITRTLDDILSLARVGRPGDPLESCELSALVAAVVEEYEDMGEPVELEDSPRLVMPVRPTWLRRALRNLIGNAVRYGGHAMVSLARENNAAVIRIRDRGPGIPDGDIAGMLEPFTRGDPSRNSETGGAGLGLTLARAVADQHGGSLTLGNLRGADGQVCGLEAVLRLPLA